METQSLSRQHVSECPLPEVCHRAVCAATYVVANPALDVTDELVLAAAALIADAGLPKMDLTASVTRYGDGSKGYWLNAKDLDAMRNTFHDSSAYAIAGTFEECLGQLSARLLTWATNAGLLAESPTYDGKELVLV